MTLKKSDFISGSLALVFAGPIGFVAAPFAYRYLEKKTKRPRLYWFILGVITLPICWTPLMLLLPETPEQIAQRKAAEKIEKAKEAELQKAEREKEFMNWAKGLEPLSRCEVELKDKLRDPDSYKADWSTIETRVDKEKQTAFLTWTFRAKNGFGGFNQAFAACNTGPMKGGVAEASFSDTP